MIAAIINILFILGVVYFIGDNSDRIKSLEVLVEKQEALINKLRSER